MELKEFIAATLQQIITGVVEAQNYIKKEKINAVVNSQIGARTDKTIEFDIAVTVNESKSTSAGGGISVASIINAGGKKQTESLEQSISRVKFSVDVLLPNFSKTQYSL